MSMYENVGMTSLDYMEEILRLRKALADVADECSKAYDKIAQLENPWVSVKDRLPEPCKAVLVYGKVGDMVNWRVDYVDELGMWARSFTVTHWMPLPEPPESEDDAG